VPSAQKLLIQLARSFHNMLVIGDHRETLQRSTPTYLPYLCFLAFI
jgi:hypothetical protein